MYTSYDRIKAALEHRTLDRIPMTESFWPETIQRWKKEGLPEDMDVYEFLGLDFICGIHPFDDGLSDAFPYTVYEETDEYKVDRNPYGVKVKYWKNSYTTHVELDHAVKDRNDWEKVKWALNPSEERIPKDIVEISKKAREKGHFITLNCSEPYWFSFVLLGMENFCVQLKIDTEFIEDICQRYMEFMEKMLKMVINKGVEWDGIWFFSDMAYKNGPMFSPSDYRRFFLPCHREISQFCKREGKFLLLHSDGNMRELLPYIIDAGFDAIQPLEARAGNDVRVYKNQFGNQICLFGNISADIIATGNHTAIEEEIKTKVLTAKQNGGYIYHSDHTIPYTVSLESYIFAVECAKKYGIY
ncbi:MAG: hypothetical protein NC932_00755 [Candidatus Omnitrophica bacterium]|nr:hypothetical protein [Candidatus Omnitrophota bacterium]